MQVVYRQPQDKVSFDIERFYKSLNKYDRIEKDVIQKAVDDMNRDLVHVSVLVELGTKLIPNEEEARRYYEEHRPEYYTNFERLRRITGYLVGSLERWNDGKKAEERERVKHGVGQYSQENKDRLEALKADAEIALGKA